MSSLSRLRIVNNANKILPIKNDDFIMPRRYEKLKSIDRKAIIHTIKGVGRIEYSDTEQQYYGTGWFIAENIIITNRHVAESFILSNSGKPINNTKIDLKVEYDNFEYDEYEIEMLISTKPESKSDIALFYVKENTHKNHNIVKFSEKFVFRRNNNINNNLIACIGYPQQPSNDDMSIFIELGSTNNKNLSMGHIKNYDENRKIFEHDCSTTKGSSGSVIIDMLTGKAIGLHFGSIDGGNNEAITVHGISEFVSQYGIELSY